MNFLYTLLYILLFILCLSVLVVVHEAGHFATAKFFKVYCKEFSIGFGPALIHKKRKNGETYFSLRAIPFGGYVSMYGEGMEEDDPELKDVDPSRSFTNIAKWKRIIILFAGVFNNAILALVLFLISESCFVQKTMYLNYLEVKEGSIAAIAGIQNEDYISVRNHTYEQDGKTISSSYYVVDKETAYITYNDETTKKVAALIDISAPTYTSRSYDNHLHFCLMTESGAINLGSEIFATETTIASINYSVTTATADYKQYIANEWVIVPEVAPENPAVGVVYKDKEAKTLKKWDGSSWKNTKYDSYGYVTPTDVKEYYVWLDTESVKTSHALTLPVTNDSEGKRVFTSSGLSFLYEEYWNNAGQVFQKTFQDFGTSATAIGRGLASLFTSAESWKDVGGIVAIGVQTTNILQNFGLGKFIYIWGLISVNLAIVNLLPFPGLDGWQIVVLIVEAVAHRDIPDKVKNIVSFIGISILFVFMILIVIKDVMGLF
ncbi:MAG: site-2 protease family protein [Bacilli bacterium]|nr:site-2 protease family protein [Bacilli bacterium]